MLLEDCALLVPVDVGTGVVAGDRACGAGLSGAVVDDFPVDGLVVGGDVVFEDSGSSGPAATETPPCSVSNTVEYVV